MKSKKKKTKAKSAKTKKKYYHPRIKRPGVGKGMNPDAWGKPGDNAGETNGRAKLSWPIVKKIRSLAAKGMGPYLIVKKLKLKVSGTQVTRIIRGEVWKK